MHIIVAALVAAFLSAPPPAAPASPAPMTTGAPAATMAPAPAVSTAPASAPAPGHPAAAAGQANFGEVISSLNNMRAKIAQVRSMNGMSVNNVQPVNVAQLNGSNPSALDNAISHNQQQLAQLRTTLASVTVTTDSNQRISIAQFLSDNKMSTANIVGADVQNGKLLLFYRKP